MPMHAVAHPISKIAVSVIDTTIVLSSVIDSTNCAICMCVSRSHHVYFQSGPLKQGMYSAYESRSNYCPPGQVCNLSLKYVLQGTVACIFIFRNRCPSGGSVRQLFGKRNIVGNVKQGDAYNSSQPGISWRLRFRCLRSMAAECCIFPP